MSLSLKNAIAYLKNHFMHAESFLKNTLSDHHSTPTTLGDLPRVLVFGEAGSGKTSLLANADINYVFSKKFVRDNLLAIARTDACDWWVDDKHAFLDINGDYLAADHDDPNLLRWQTLLKLVTAEGQSLHGIILVIDCYALITSTHEQQDALIKHLINGLEYVNQYAKFPLNVCMVFTKMDRIQGFNEFFSDLNSTERKERFGFMLDEKPYTDLSEFEGAFQQNFNDLITQLNQRLIWRLHQEYDIKKRALIKDFPLAFEALKTKLSPFLVKLITKAQLLTQLKFSQFYFSSSVQKASTTSQLLAPINQHCQLATLDQEQTTQTKAYFTHQVLTDLQTLSTAAITKQTITREYQLKKRARIACLIAFSVALALGTGNFVYAFKRNVDRVAEVEAQLSQFNVLEKQLDPSDNNLLACLPILNALNNANELLSHTEMPWLFKKSNLALSLLKKKLAERYEEVLRTQFTPRLLKLVRAQLLSAFNQRDFSADKPQNTARLYGTLKAYLMIAQDDKWNPVFLTAWFSNYSNLNLDDAQRSAIQTYLKQKDLTLPEKHRMDFDLVEKTRHALWGLPSAKLAYAILQNIPDNYPINPFTDSDKVTTADLDHFFTFSQKGLTLPALYTRKGYETLFLKFLSAASETALKGNWVLGDNNTTQSSDTTLQTLQQQVTMMYLSDYTQNWQDLLNTINLRNFSTIGEEQHLLDKMLTKPSPFAAVLNTIMINTTLAGTTLLPRFNSLSTPDRLTGVPLNQLLQDLNAYYDRVSNVSHAENSNQAAFEWTKSRFESEKDTDDPLTNLFRDSMRLPEPLKTWLSQLSLEGWSVLMSTTHDYINTQWEETIIPSYNQNIRDRFPVFKEAKTPIELDQFTQFFAPHGLIDDFYLTYLKPFIAVENGRWAWQTKDGVALALPSELLSQVRRAKIIAKMFFPDEAPHLAIPFQLQVNSLEPIVKTLTLTIDNEPHTFSLHHNPLLALSWPNKSDQISLSFKAINGEEQHITLNGPWAWFELLARANLKPTTDPKHFTLTLAMGGEAARLDLIADTPVNPFIPDVVDGFRCPAVL